MFPLILLRAAGLNQHEQNWTSQLLRSRTGRKCCPIRRHEVATEFKPNLLASGFIELCIPSPKRAPTSADWIYELKIAATG